MVYFKARICSCRSDCSSLKGQNLKLCSFVEIFKSATTNELIGKVVNMQIIYDAAQLRQPHIEKNSTNLLGKCHRKIAIT